MMKFFRKYNRHILAGLVVFLMIVFLVGDVLTSRSSGPQYVDWGTVRGEMLKNDVTAGVLRTKSVLEDLGIDLARPWMYLRGLGERLPLPPLTVDQATLLILEAQRDGLSVGEQQVDAFIQAAGIPPQRINALRQNKNLRLADIRGAIATLLAVLRRAELMLDVIHVSEDEIRRFVRDTQETVAVQFVAFPAARFVDAAQEFPAERIQAHFEQYRDVAPEEGKPGFGYRWPERVALECLVLRVDDVMPQVTVTEEAARGHYRKYRTRYVSTAPASQAASAPVTSGQASASAPASTSAPAALQRPFAEVRAEIEAELRRQQAAARAQQIAEQLASELAAPWDDQARGPDGYLERPAGVDAAGFLEQAGRAATDKFRVTVLYRHTGLLTREMAAEDADIGGAMQAGESRMMAPADQYCFRVQGLLDARTLGDTESRLSLYQPVFVPFVKRGADGNPERFVVFRVVDARKPEPPASVDEVRERVIEDLRLAEADRRADEMAERLYAVAATAGLSAALEADPELRARLMSKGPNESDDAVPKGTPLVTPAPFARRMRSPFFEGPPFIEGLGMSAAVVEAAFEMTALDWQAKPSSQPAATKPAVPATQPAPKVRIERMPESLNRVVLELRDMQRVTEDALKVARLTARRQLQQARQYLALAGWFRGEAVAQRMQFVPARRAELIESDVQ